MIRLHCSYVTQYRGHDDLFDWTHQNRDVDANLFTRAMTSS